MITPKICITIGEQCLNNGSLYQLLDLNIDAIRINSGRVSFEKINTILSELSTLGFPMEKVYLDIGNQKTRIELNDNQNSLAIHTGDVIILHKKSQSANHMVSLDSTDFFMKIQKGDVVYFGDGEKEAEVLNITPNNISLLSKFTGEITDKLSIGIKGKAISHYRLNEKETEEIQTLLSKYRLNLILSFVETKTDVLSTKDSFPSALTIVPKIETAAAVENIEDIMSISNSIFIGRGDLGLAIGVEKIGICQHKLIKAAHNANCKTAIGTGVLDSLRWNHNEMPTRAEICDITNLCIQNVDTIVLTSETGGRDPLKATIWLQRIVEYIKSLSLDEI